MPLFKGDFGIYSLEGKLVTTVKLNNSKSYVNVKNGIYLVRSLNAHAKAGEQVMVIK